MILPHHVLFDNLEWNQTPYRPLVLARRAGDNPDRYKVTTFSEISLNAIIESGLKNALGRVEHIVG
jgi:hypothetical protein